MSEFAPKGQPNVPDWTEDANSPFTASGEADLSGTLADNSLDQYLFIVHKLVGDGTGSGDWTMTVNGQANGYDYTDNADTQTLGASQWVLIPTIPDNYEVAGRMEFFTKGSDVLRGPVALSALEAPTGVASQVQINETSLDSFVIDHGAGGSITGTIEVLGRAAP